MATEPIIVYLDDHLAGSATAIQILEVLRDDTGLGAWSSAMLKEIEADRRVLSDLRLRIDQTPNPLKEAIGWVAGTLGRVKLHQQVSGPVGKLEALETLAIGIQGKHALWKALQVASDRRLSGVDFERLRARALAQYDEVEERRLEVARAVLGTTSVI
jgi:hypothetical protein